MKSPPIFYMQIALWIAQLLLDYIKSANNVLESELEHQIRRSKELQANLTALKTATEMYEQSIDRLMKDNQRLKEAVDVMRMAHEDLRDRRNQLRKEYELELEKTADEQILRAEI